jgi:hypothetical protein
MQHAFFDRPSPRLSNDHEAAREQVPTRVGSIRLSGAQLEPVPSKHRRSGIPCLNGTTRDFFRNRSHGRALLKPRLQVERHRFKWTVCVPVLNDAEGVREQNACAPRVLH